MYAAPEQIIFLTTDFKNDYILSNSKLTLTNKYNILLTMKKLTKHKILASFKFHLQLSRNIFFKEKEGPFLVLIFRFLKFHNEI